MRIKPLPRAGFLPALLAAAAVGVAGYYTARAVVRHKRYFDLKNKVAVVTGGSKGLGLAIAHELATRGAKIAICARGDEDLKLAHDELEWRNATVYAQNCDVTDAAQIESFLQEVRTRLGAIDVLVNNAGTITVGPLPHQQLDDFKDVMDVNFYGPLHFVLNVMPEMRARGSGRIVNIASFGGKVPAPHMAPYASSKFAFVGLSETLDTELMADNIYVTTVCPGLMRTGSPQNAVFKGQHEKEKAMFWTGDNAPLVSISPERMAKRIVSAMQYGDAELIAPFVAKIQSAIHGLMPNITIEIATLIAGLLPKPTTDEGGDQRREGYDINADDLTGEGTKHRQDEAERKYQHKNKRMDRED